MGAKHSKAKLKNKQQKTNGSTIANGDTAANGKPIVESQPAALKEEKKKKKKIFRFKRRNSMKEIRSKEGQLPPTPVDNIDGTTVANGFALENEIIIDETRESLKGSKEKSRSVSNFMRATSLRGSSMKAINSIMNLHRSNSLRSLLGREKRNKRRHEIETGEVESADDSECHFEKLYEGDLHLKIFEYFTLKERIHLRAVCYKWDKDIFREQRYLRFPLFQAHSVPANNRQAKLMSKKYLYYCFNLKTLLIDQELTRALFLDLLKCLHRSHLEEIVFNLEGKPKNEVIQFNLYGNFCRDFARQLKSIGFEMQNPKSRQLKHADFSNNDTTDFILLMTILHDNLFTSLVNFELILSTKLTQGYFRKFLRFYHARLEKLTIRFCFKIDEFNELTATILEDLRGIKKLKSLTLFLVPFAVTESRIDIEQLLNTIASLADDLPVLESFKLTIESRTVNLTRLNVIKPFASFRKVASLSLTIFGTIDQIDPVDFEFDFRSIRFLPKLRHFELNCAKLSVDDIERLTWACPQLTSLSIGCDVRLTNVAMDRIPRVLSSLERLSISGSRCFNPYDGEAKSKEYLFIDNEALGTLFDVVLGKGHESLRHIELENCRIMPEDSALLNKIKAWAATDPQAWFSLSLRHNRYPLTFSHFFMGAYHQFMRANLKFYFD